MFQYKPPGKTYNVGSYTTSEREITDLAKGWAAISLAFAILLSGGIGAMSFWYNLLISVVAVGTGFILHELGHKVMAQRYGLKAEFRSFDTMLFLALLMSFFGFIFAAPGAVMIHGRVMKRENGWISVTGPIINLALAAVFLALWVAIPYLTQVWYYGYFINVLLALFNMIPFGMFDGKKVMAWSTKAWGMVVGTGILLMVIKSAVA